MYVLFPPNTIQQYKSSNKKIICQSRSKWKLSKEKEGKVEQKKFFLNKTKQSIIQGQEYLKRKKIKKYVNYRM